MERGLGRAAIAAGAGVQQLMNRLTDHLWLYHKTETQGRANPNSREKSEVLSWFGGLSVAQRQEVLLVKDREWIGVLLQMQKKLESGPMNFFLMLDMGDPGARSGVLRSITPELLCRRPVGLLARLEAQNTAGKELTDSLLFFSSQSPQVGAGVFKRGSSKKGKKKETHVKKNEGGAEAHALVKQNQHTLVKENQPTLVKENQPTLVKENQPTLVKENQPTLVKENQPTLVKENQVDAMVVARTLLEDPLRLVHVLDCLTLGQFLQAPCKQQALGSWDETPWLHSMGYCALPFYVANRLELAIWSAWFRSNPARSSRLPGLDLTKARQSRLSKAASQQQASGATAVSVLEKHCALQGWWQKLGAAEKSNVLRAGAARLARQLATESVMDAQKGRDLKERGVSGAALDELGSKRPGVALRSAQKDLASSREGLKKNPWLAGLLALQELSESGVLAHQRQASGAGHAEESGASQGVVRRSAESVGRNWGVRTRGGRRGELEKELEWLVMTHGIREGGIGSDEGLFCTSLELANTLRGQLLCRLRHVIQQLMQEHIARDLLDSLDTTAKSPEPRQGAKAGGSASKSAKKKKSGRTRSVSGHLAAAEQSSQKRSDQEASIPSVEQGPGGAVPVEETKQNQAASASVEFPASGAQAALSEPRGGRNGVDMRPPDLYMKGAESMNETDDDERCSSSGDVWEEVGTAKRRKDRRKRVDDKDVKREPRKRATQPLEAPWAVPEAHVGQNGGTETEGEHRKRRRRRKGKEKKREDAASEAGGAVAVGSVDVGSKQKGLEMSGVTSVGEKALEGVRHRGWNLAAPAFEPRSVPKKPSMLDDGQYPGRESGIGANQNGLSHKAPYRTGFGLTRPEAASNRSEATSIPVEASSRNTLTQVGLSGSGAGVRSNQRGLTNGPTSDHPNPRFSEGMFKRSLSVGNAPNAPGVKATDSQASTANAARAVAQRTSPLVVPITPLKQAPRQPKAPASSSDGPWSQEPPPALSETSFAPEGIPQLEDSRHHWHEWPQYCGTPEQPSSAIAAQTGPQGGEGPVHVAGFVVPCSSGSNHQAPLSFPNQSGFPQLGSSISTTSSLSGQVANSCPNRAAQAPFPAHIGTSCNSEAVPLPAPTPFHPSGDFAPAFQRPVAIHRSRSSHQLPDNGYPVETPGPFWETEHFSYTGRPFPGSLEPSTMKPPEQWPVGIQLGGVQSLSPESPWPPALPRITVPTADYFTDEDWMMGGGEDLEGSGRNGNAYDVESEAEANGRYVMSETEVEGPRFATSFPPNAAQDDSRIDYSRIFDGGVLYWTADNYSTLGASRPNSLSSNDSMWIRREADISVIVDDIAGAASPSYVAAAADVSADVSTPPRASPAPSERAASPLLAPPDARTERDPPETARARMPRVRAVRLQGSRPSPVLVRANLAHTPPRSVYRGLSPDLRYHRGLSPDTFVRHLPSYQVPPLARQNSVGAANDISALDVRWKRPSSPVLRFNAAPNHAPPAVPPLASAPRARPANVRSGSSSPRHWAPALEKGEKAPGIDAEGSFRVVGAPEFGTGGGGFSLGEKLAAVAGSGGFARNSLVKKGLPPLAPVTHSPDQDHPDALIPIHHWVTIPPFDRQAECVGTQPEPEPEKLEGPEVVSVDPAGFGEVTALQPAVPFSPVTPLSPPETQQAPPKWALFHDLLHTEVERFCAENREEMAKKRPFQLAAISKVSKALQVLWPRSRITVFGSFITGLALPTSDIDLLVCLPPVRSLEPIKEAGILEGRNGIKETMLQHAARYLADQGWVKTDSMKTIENTAVPIIQLVAEMPLQPLQVSPGEKSTEQRPGNGSPSEGPGESTGQLSGVGDIKEGSSPAEVVAMSLSLGGERSAPMEGVTVEKSSQAVGPGETHSPSDSDKLWPSANGTAVGTGDSLEGRAHEGAEGLESGPLTGGTGGASSLVPVGAESGSKSCPEAGAETEPPGDGGSSERTPPNAGPVTSPAIGAAADVSTAETPLAEVSTGPGLTEGRASGIGAAEGGAANRTFAGRGHSAPGEMPPEGAVRAGSAAEKIGWRGHVATIRTRHVAGPDSPGDQERRLVKLDISFEGAQHTGSRTTDLVRELVAQFPPLPPLVLVLKQFLTDRSLDHPYTGGLSSYCLVLLVTRFLQHQQHVSGVRAQQAGQNLGLLLMDFLHFFGCVFDPRRMGVSIRGGGMYIDRDKGHSIDPLYIEDPLNPLNNVGRNCFRILQCTKAFGEGYVLLSKQLHEIDAKEPHANLFGKILIKCAT